MISFDSNNLQSAYILINKLNKSDAPSRELQSENLSFQDGFNVVTNFWRSRTIAIGGTIDATSAAHLADTLDTLKQNLSGVNKNLDVDYGSSTRRYKGTLTKFDAPEEFYNITHIPYSAEFLCQPFGYATSPTSYTSNGVTSLSETNVVTLLGSYAPQPIITITFNTASGATGMSLANVNTADVISLTTAITAGTVIVINTETNKITKDGTQIDFSGPIPSFITGSNSITLAVNATSVNYDLDITYTPTYL